MQIIQIFQNIRYQAYLPAKMLAMGLLQAKPRSIIPHDLSDAFILMLQEGTPKPSGQKGKKHVEFVLSPRNG